LLQKLPLSLKFVSKACHSHERTLEKIDRDQKKAGTEI
jgi:hypothetical protein